MKEWNYRAEGNLHIIIANEKTRQVLRLLKCLKDKTIYNEYWASEATESELCFIRYVAHPLMENCKACFPIQKVAVSREFLKLISKKIEPGRPKIRLSKVVDQSCKFGILMPDFCQILPPTLSISQPTISVEIKPKQGFILVGSDRCKYSHFQLLKMQNNTYDRISTYCPVDLFSGSKKRMQRAIKALISDPQNNFRVFRGGDVIYSQEIVQQSKLKAKELFRKNVLTTMSCLTHHGGPANLEESFQDFQDVLCNMLLHPVCKLQHPPHAAQFCERHSNIDSNRKLPSLCNGFGEECDLPADCILGLLLSLQKLESYTIEEYYKMYVLLQDHLRVFPEERDVLSLEGPYDAQCWRDLVDEIKCHSNYDTQSDEMWKLDMTKAASTLRKFLIAASFKDCSIIMTFRARSARGNVDSEESTYPVVIKTCCKQQEYFASLAIVDSDPKPATRIPEYYRSTFANDSL